MVGEDTYHGYQVKSQKIMLSEKEMKALAAETFKTHPTAKAVIVFPDGNCFLDSSVNFARLHAGESKLDSITVNASSVLSEEEISEAAKVAAEKAEAKAKADAEKAEAKAKADAEKAALGNGEQKPSAKATKGKSFTKPAQS